MIQRFLGSIAIAAVLMTAPVAAQADPRWEQRIYVAGPDQVIRHIVIPRGSERVRFETEAYRCTVVLDGRSQDASMSCVPRSRGQTLTWKGSSRAITRCIAGPAYVIWEGGNTTEAEMSSMARSLERNRGCG